MNLPISKPDAIKASNWLKQHFELQIKEMIAGTPWSVNDVCAIFCQETAYKVLLWIDKFEPLEILARCVFDSSGDFPGRPRYVWPRNKAEFEKVYGPFVTKMLIDEGNLQRKMPQRDAPTGYSEADYLYKGYGIFQNDLQNIKTDPEFFLFKKWYNFSDCMQRLVGELNSKAALHDNLRSIAKAYNGTGPCC
jgi:hypothetical protein